MENSSTNPSFSICDIRIQKQMSRSFGKSFPQKIVLLKLRPHCSATASQSLGNTKEKTLLVFLIWREVFFVGVFTFYEYTRNIE
jgi:hypothetical protein